MPNYRAHGLTLSSNRPIRQLVESASDASPDLHIVFDEMPASAEELGASDPWFHGAYHTADGQPALVATRRADGRWLQFQYADGLMFLVDAEATTIWVNFNISISDPAAATADDATAYLLGPVMGILLRLRGVTCLHASAVEIDGQAYAFVGPSGAGKSTMAATFAGAGFHVLSDDTVTLRWHDDAWWVAPGYPRLRLWPDALRAVTMAGLSAVVDAVAASRVHVNLAAQDLFAREAVPLAAVYVIEFEENLSHPQVTAISPADVLPELSANTFANRVLDRQRRTQEFTTLANLLEAIPARRLARPQNLSALAAVRAAVLEDIAAAARHA